MRTRCLAALALVAAASLAASSAATAAGPGRHALRPVELTGRIVTFEPAGLRASRIWHARLEARGFCRRLRVRRVRRAVAAGALRVRLPRSVARRFARTGRRPLLVLYTRRARVRVPARARLTAPCAPLPTDRQAARRVRRSSFEPRPGNAEANYRVPTASELAHWRGRSNYRRLGGRPFYLARVTGHFTGTTDEILQWAARKWGFDEDVVRAQAVRESDWNQWEIGDGGVSFGILQLKSTRQRATFPLSRKYTAFNADYAMMTLRHCYDGYATWLRHGYRAGDVWGCLGYYWSGRWNTAGGHRYARNVRRERAARTWAQPSF